MPSPAQFLREYKIVLLGDTFVGKTALVCQFIESRYYEYLDPTSEDSYRKQYVVDDEPALLDVLDTSGVEEYRTMREQYMITAEGFLLIYSITSRSTFEEIDTIYQQISRVKNGDLVPIVIVAAKCDLEHERMVDHNEGIELAKTLNCKFIETSAKTRLNVDETFTSIVREMRRYNRERQTGLSSGLSAGGRTENDFQKETLGNRSWNSGQRFRALWTSVIGGPGSQTRRKEAPAHSEKDIHTPREGIQSGRGGVFMGPLLEGSKTNSENPINILGLDENNLPASLNELLNTSDGREAALRLTGSTARVFLDILQEVIDTETKLRPLLPNSQYCFRKLSEKSGMLPSSLFVKDVQRLGEHPVHGGGFADIWKGMYHGNMVALKVLRFFGTDVLQAQKEFCREALAWRQLHHPNVAPFYGVCTDLFVPHMCMVSPWMTNGNILDYLKKNPDFEREKLATQGIQYLHSLQPMLVHGDIRGANVLVTDDLRPVLTDFGFATVADNPTIAMSANSAASLKGSLRWMAPELFSPSMSDAGAYRRGPTTDVYAFACLAFEVYAGRPPFPPHYLDPAIMFEVMRGNRPDRPTSGVPIPDEMWALMQTCWAQTPSDRPEMIRVAKRLKYIAYDLQLAPLDASNEGSIRSQSARFPTELEIINTRPNSVLLYWLNYEGRRVLYRSILPRKSTTQSTYMTHPWLITDEPPAVDVLGIWSPEETYSKIILR